VYFIVASLYVLTAQVVVCEFHAELEGNLLTNEKTQTTQNKTSLV